MDIQEIRKDFPILGEVVYLDSASTSLTPDPVLEAVLSYYHEYRANVGRGVHRLAQLAHQRYRDAHRKVGDLIHADEGTLVFTRNTTESINVVSRGLLFKRGDKVVTTRLEHHSNFLPWLRLKKKGVDLEIVAPDKLGIFNISDFEEAIDESTRLVAVSHLSNVLGTLLPIQEIADICKDWDVMLLVDGAQSVPHTPVNVKDLGCNFLCFSGHKMLGPTGTGALWMKKDEDVEPLLAGGGMVEDIQGEIYQIKRGYEGFEAGTPNISGGIGFGAAVDYLKNVGIDEILRHEQKLTRRLLEGLQEIEGIEVYGPRDTKDRGGVVSFNVRGLLPNEVALMLDEASNIMVRSGHHCCIPLMKHLGLKYGCVRASIYLYNTIEEIDKLLVTIEEIAEVV